MDNCYKLWTKKEEELLIDLYKRNFKIHEICNILKRTSGAIHSRLDKLNLKNNNISLKLENDIECILDELKKIHLILIEIKNNNKIIYTEI